MIGEFIIIDLTYLMLPSEVRNVHNFLHKSLPQHTPFKFGCETSRVGVAKRSVGTKTSTVGTTWDKMSWVRNVWGGSRLGAKRHGIYVTGALNSPIITWLS